MDAEGKKLKLKLQGEKIKRWGKIRDEDPDPVGSVDFWPAGSGTFFNGSGSVSYL